MPTVRGRSLLPRLSLKYLPLISSAAAIKTCSTFDLPHPALWRPLTRAASRDTSDPTLGDDGHRSALIKFSACVQTHVKMLDVMLKTGDAPVNLFFVKSSPGSGKMW